MDGAIFNGNGGVHVKINMNQKVQTMNGMVCDESMTELNRWYTRSSHTHTHTHLMFRSFHIVHAAHYLRATTPIHHDLREPMRESIPTTAITPVYLAITRFIL